MSMKITTAFTLLLAVEYASAFGIKKFFTSTKPKGPVAPKAPGPKLPPMVLDNKGLDYIFAKNAKWQKKKLEQDPKFFDKLGTTHTPDYMYIGESRGPFVEEIDSTNPK